MDIETAFDHVGHFGLRQRLYYLINGMKEIWVAAPMMQLVFVSVAPKQFWCYDGNGKLHNNTCPQNNPNECSSVQYIYDYGASSIISEWNLICSENYKVQLVQSLYMCGVLSGAVIFGYLSDTLGRLKTFTITFFFTWLFASLASIAPSYWTFVIIRFLCGMCAQVNLFILAL
ncbi:Solute carrier family 22 member 15-like [Nymphon striatum]|nr:Solute carrier family 22 member 15-like [Nymphon striatum]